MTDTEINIAIAEACGRLKREEGETVEFQRPDPPNAVYQRVRFKDGSTRACYITNLPNYCSDLNAMHQAVTSSLKMFDDGEKYISTLLKVVAPDYERDELIGAWSLIHATARQRAEAFLRTIGKWRDA